MRRIASPNEFFDILDRMGDNKFVTIGYVSGANLNVPKIKKLNPQTNRMKGYDDYSSFGEEEIGALVKITSYNMRYRKRDAVAKQYADYKNSANSIRGEFGLEPIADKGTTYKDRMNYGEQGIDLYKGDNDSLQGHSYYGQNTYGVKPKSIVYCVGTDGHIIKALDKEQIVPYLKAKREVDGVSALRKMGVEDERIQDYISKMQGLKMSYKNFEANSILWIAATVQGEKIVYINDNLARTVNDIDINPQDFIAIAKKRYAQDLQQIQENMENTNKKGIFRLTESELTQMIKESASKILSELDWRTYASAAKKNDIWRKENPNHRANQWNRSYDFRNAARDAFDKAHGLDHQFDEPNSKYGGDKGSINLNAMDDFSVTGTRDHDFGDGDAHGLRHNVYHMGKKYGKDGGYGRTRMWDYAHETTPERFYGTKEMGQKFRDAEKDAEDFNSGKSHYVKGRGWENESKQPMKAIEEGSFGKGGNGRIKGDIYGTKLSKEGSKYARELMKQTQEKEKVNEGLNNQNYSHFAVSKKSGKIMNGWDYSKYEPSELRQFKKDYFDNDMADYGFNPKDFRILTYKYLVRNGIDPNDDTNWANNDEANAEFVG